MRSFFFSALSILILLLVPSVLFGQTTYTWDDGGAPLTWEDPINWTADLGYPGDGASPSPPDSAVISAGGNADINSLLVALDNLTLSGGRTLTNTTANPFTVNNTVTLFGTIDGGTGNLVFNNITLTGNSTIQTTSGNITITGTISGGFNLTITSTIGSITISGPVDDIPNLNVSSTSGAISVSGNVGQITALGNLSVTSTSGDITYSSASDVTTNMTLNSGAGVLNLAGSSVDLCSGTMTLATTDNGAIQLPATNITGNLVVTANNAPGVSDNGLVTVSGNANISATSGTIDLANIGPITLGSFTFDAGFFVNLNETNATNIITGTGTSLTITSGGNIISGALSIGGASTFTATGNITVNGVVTLTGNSALTLNGGTSTFNSAITDDGGSWNLALNAGVNALVVNAAIGGTPFASAALTGGTINLGADITTSGALDLTDAVTVTNNVTLTSTGGSITFDGKVDDDTNNRNLTVIASVNTVLTAGTSALGGIDRLGDLMVSGGTFVTNNNAVSLSGSLLGAGSLTAGTSAIAIGTSMSITGFAMGTSTVTFDEGNNGNVGGYTFFNLTFNKAAGVDTITSTAGLTVSSVLTMTQGTWDAGAFLHQIAGNWDASSGNFLFTANTSEIRLTTAGAQISHNTGFDDFNDLTITNGGQLNTDVIVGGTLDLVAGNLNTQTFNLTVSGTLDHQAGTITGTTGTILVDGATLGAPITKSGGNINFTGVGAVTLVGATALSTGAGAGNILLDNPFTGAQALSADAGTGTVTVSAILGGGPALSSAVLSGGTVTVGAAVTTSGLVTITGTTVINLGSIITTAGSAITMTGPVVLTATTTVTSGVGGGNISFSSTIDEQVASGPFDLTVNAGTGTAGFGGIIGTNAGSGVEPNNLSVIGTGGITFSAAVYLLGNLDVTGGAGGTSQGGEIVAVGNLTVSSGILTTNNNAINISGSLLGAGSLTAGTSAIAIGTSMSITGFVMGTSTVTFDEGNNGNVGGYTFFNLTFNKAAGVDTITSTADLTVTNGLTLTQGVWDLDDGAGGAETHTISVDWDSTAATFDFDSTNSTVVFDGNSSTLFTKGIGTQSFVNLIVNKNAGQILTLVNNPANGLEVTGNLTITSGILDVSAGNRPIEITGTWDNNSGVNTFNAQNGTVTFVGGASFLEAGGATNDFWNLTIDDSVVNVRVDDLTVTNNLTVSDDSDTGAATTLDFTTTPGLTLTATNLIYADSGTAIALPVLDLGDWNIDVTTVYDAMITDNAWPALDEMGRLRMTGTRATMNLPDLSATPENMGIVEFYGGATDVPAVYNRNHFWHIIINGGNLTLNRDIVVYGRSGTPNGALAEPVETMYPGVLDLMGIQILAGGSLDLNGHDVDIFGSLFNAVGPAGFVHSNGNLELVGDFPALIAGSNTFYGFIINDQTGTARDVGGKIVYFEQGTTTTIANIVGASFDILGDNGSGTPPTPPPGIAGLPDGTEWVYLVSSNDGTHWWFIKNINATLAMQFVYVRDSNATLQPLVIPPDVLVDNCPGWVIEIYVELSWTRDTDSNGRIDRLYVNTAAAVNMDFTDFEVSVNGYTVISYSDDAAEPTNAFFWIHLEEKDALDTGVNPAWRIDQNTSLVETGPVGAPLALYPSKTEEIPYDDAPPIIGYTLAVADAARNEVFIHFSEQLVDTNGGGWTNNFDVTALTNNVGGVPVGVTVVTPSVGPTMQEALLDIGGLITTGDIQSNAQIIVNAVEDIPTPPSLLPEDALDPADAAQGLVDNDHRVSDLALGIVGNGMVEPVVATGQTQPAGGAGVGIVMSFDGSDFLQDEDINLQAHLHNDFGALALRLYWDNGVTSSYRRNGLWLPTFVEITGFDGNFSGLVPRPWTTYNNAAMNALGAGNLYDYDWPATDSKISSGTDLEFFFRIPAGPTFLYAARIVDDTASDWYRKIRPWSILIHDVVTQAGGISILNNIINPNRNEHTSLHYELTRGGTVNIQIFDLAGGLVEVLQRGYQDPGEYSVSWNGRNRSGNVVARGIYFIRYVGPGGIDQIRKVLVVK